jgi:hypothetical protein
MTAHQFARQLLEGPDLPIGVPACTYDPDDNALYAPEVCEVDADETEGDEQRKLLLISYRRHTTWPELAQIIIKNWNDK